MSLRTFVTTVVILVLALGPTSAAAEVAGAQPPDAETSPAPLGSAVVEDALLGPGLVVPFVCATGRGGRDFSDEGLAVRVHGRCGSAADMVASVGTRFSGLVVPDGEVRMEVRALAGADRLSFRVAFRTQQSDGLAIGYRVHVDPGVDAVTIVKQTADQSAPIARRTGIARRLGSGEWMAVSVRFEGPRIWLFLDDALVLNATDDSFLAGDAGFFVSRLGNPDDDAEVAVTVRNVRVSGLADGDPERLPRLGEAAVSPPAPAVGEVILEESLIQPTVIPAGRCQTGLASVEHVGDGVLMKTRGRCRPESTAVALSEVVRGLSVLDGDVAVSFKAVNGTPRTQVTLNARLRDRIALSVIVNPATGFASLSRFEDGNVRRLASREDAHRLAKPGDWNRLALRMRGAEVWVLLNEQPLLYSADADLGVGGAGFGTVRSGSLDDDQESAVVFADLKVSALEDGDPSRWPSFRRP